MLIHICDDIISYEVWVYTRAIALVSYVQRALDVAAKKERWENLSQLFQVCPFFS